MRLSSVSWKTTSKFRMKAQFLLALEQAYREASTLFCRSALKSEEFLFRELVIKIYLEAQAIASLINQPF